jgi:hypothetical protein
MTDEPTPFSDAARIHLTDQAEANMAALGRQYAALYRAMVENGAPDTLAQAVVLNQQHANLQIGVAKELRG